MCQDCSATFSTTDIHSCVYYLQRLIRTIVGDTVFGKAQASVDVSFKGGRLSTGACQGAVEGILWDSFVGFKNKMESEFDEHVRKVKEEQTKLILGM